MVTSPGEPAASFDAEDLDLASGLIFALDVCLSDIQVGEVLELTSRNPAVNHELPAWCRGTGHRLVATEPDGWNGTIFLIERGPHGSLMFKDRPDWGITPAFRHDGFDTRDWLVGKAGEIPERAYPTTGFSPRGAVVEDGAPAFPYPENDRDQKSEPDDERTEGDALQADAGQFHDREGDGKHQWNCNRHHDAGAPA